ncbi:MAG: hypothetical protein ACREAE_08615, partial [Nitrosopumilaceae archaeon]
HQVLKNSCQFYKNLLKIISYTKPVNPFPSEAHQVEWMCHLIYTSNYEVQDYMNGDIEFDEALLKSKEKISNLISKNPPNKLNSDGLTDQDGEVLPEHLLNVVKKCDDKKAINILELGVHSWKSLEAWTSRFPAAKVVGVGVLELPPKKEIDESVKYIQLPLEEFIKSGLSEKENYDLIVYQGYHLKRDADFLGQMSASHLGENGALIILDVLGSPSRLMKTILQKGRSWQWYLKLGCAPLNSNKLSGSYVVTATKRKRLIFRNFYYYFFNQVLILFYAGHWKLKRIPEYIRRILIV